MKTIIAYVNTHRVHWLVEELGAIGIHDIVVTEYFKYGSQISRFEFLAQASAVDNVKTLIHRVGTNGSPGDHFIEIYDQTTNI